VVGEDAPHSSLFELSDHAGTLLQDPDGQVYGLTVDEDIAYALENTCTPQDEKQAITTPFRRAAWASRTTLAKRHTSYRAGRNSG
jgi:ABC-type cobalt transport system, ATPase component